MDRPLFTVIGCPNREIRIEERHSRVERVSELIDCIVKSLSGFVHNQIDQFVLRAAGSIFLPESLESLCIHCLAALHALRCRIYSHRSARLRGCAANSCRGINAKNLRAGISGIAVCHDAGSTEADNDNIIALNHNRFSALFRLHLEILHVTAGFFNRHADSIADTGRRQCRTGRCIHSNALRLDNPRNEGVYRGLKNGIIIFRPFATAVSHFNCSDGVILEGNRNFERNRKVVSINSFFISAVFHCRFCTCHPTA